MTVTIEMYRSFSITFNTDKATFECEIKDTGKESKSFEAVKKWIDEYCKDNATFEPFYVVTNPGSYKNKERLKVVGIRKDGRFVAEDKKGDKKQISDYDEKDYLIDKPEYEHLFAELAVAKLKTDAARKEEKSIEDKIIGETLKSVKQNYIQQK